MKHPVLWDRNYYYKNQAETLQHTGWETVFRVALLNNAGNEVHFYGVQ